jgi:hypothetical protein
MTPKMIAKRHPIPNSQKRPKIREAMAKPLVVVPATTTGVDA